MRTTRDEPAVYLFAARALLLEHADSHGLLLALDRYGRKSRAQRSRPTYFIRLRFMSALPGLGAPISRAARLTASPMHRVLATERGADLTGEDVAAVDADLVLELEA